MACLYDEVSLKDLKILLNIANNTKHTFLNII